MGSYFMEDSRRYSGYDEYTGIFGPLKASSSYGSRSQRRLPPSRRKFTESGALAALRKGRRPPPRNLDRRAKFLADRKAKRSLQPPLGPESDGSDGLQEQETQPASPTHGLQRQVWLPTRNFAFRQRAGKLDTRAIARLDLEQIAATTDVETIQRHLDNLAFADVTQDDVQHYSDAYFLKLFQIAQLTLEYLMHVQDSLVDHSEGLEKQCDQLLTECQQLESENGQHETEIASLKREIRQKQRTMATLELMLLHASASTRMSSSAKENAANEANALVDELLSKRADPPAVEDGAITNPVTCVLCKKRFMSAEYLLRHQERRHQDAKDKPKKKKEYASGSSSDDDDKENKKAKKPTPLPKEIVDALEEKNQLARQLMALQDQVRHEQEARDRQRQQFESQQNNLCSRMEHYMEKLQSSLAEIEKKQEATKQDLRQYTQESIARIQVEAANAELLRLQQQKASRAGRLENDEGNRPQPVEVKANEDMKWAEKVEKLMETFLKAQTQKQQEIDALEQESNKLWTKYNKLKKKKQLRPEPTMTLADLTAFGADRFGVDRGEVEEETPMENKSIRPALLEDKPVQTEDDGAEMKPSRRPSPTTFLEKLTEAEYKPAPVTPKAKAIELKPVSEPDEIPPPLVEISPPAPVVEIKPKQVDPKASFQQAAHVIGKVSLGFLTRQAMAKSSNWRITIPISSLESSLTAAELEFARTQYDSGELQVQVEEEMKANDLRVLIAKALSGKDEFESADAVGGTDKDKLPITATMTYHRVLLHHKRTGNELCGPVLIQEFKNDVEVEVIPYHETSAAQINQVVDFHEKMTDRMRDIRRASLELSSTDLPTIGDENKESTDRKLTLDRIVQMQALVRGFLAKKRVELLKIDRLVDARLVKMSTEKMGPIGSRALEPSWMSSDPVLAAEYDKIQRKLAEVVKAKLGRDSQQDGLDDERLSVAEYENQLGGLEDEQKSLAGDTQRRIQLLTQRLNPMATGEYRRKQSEASKRLQSKSSGTAAKIHRAVQVEVVRKRLKRLVADDDAQDDAMASSSTRQGPEGMKSLLSSWLAESKERVRATSEDTSIGTFDSREIATLANAYEEGNSPVELPRLKPRSEGLRVPPTIAKDLDKQQGSIRQLTPRVDGDESPLPSARPGTPNPQRDAGHSPRPNPSAHAISPFSKTPLISRAARRTGFYNAR